MDAKKNSAQAQSNLALMLAVLPALFLFWLHRTAPYFPREFDDADHWVQTVLFARGGRGWEIFREIYFNRTFRPILFPALGVPFFLATRSVAAATGLILPLLLAAFGIVSFRIFRRWLPLWRSLWATWALCTLPVVMVETGAYYMAELPYLCACALALHLASLEKTGALSRIAVPFCVALALCLRPAEAAFLGAFAFAYVFWKKPGRRRLVVAQALGALFLAALWYYPFLPLLQRWLRVAFFHFGPLSPSIHSQAQFGARALEALQLAKNAFTWPGLLLAAVTFGASIRREKRISFDQAWILLVGFLPFVIAFLIPFRITAGEPRHVIATTVLCLGYCLVRALRRNALGLALASALLLGNLASLPALVKAHFEIMAAGTRQRDACLATTRALPDLDAAPDGASMLFVNETDLPLGGTTCTLALLEKGKYVRLGLDWDSRFVFWSLIRRHDAIVVISGKQERASDPAALSAEKREQLRFALNEEIFPLRQTQTFRFEGREFQAAWHSKRKQP